MDEARLLMHSGGMRFIAGGPDIPEELLVARDKGDVIFFCGAGVSQAYAHLPNFERLGRHVIRILGAALDSPARRLLDKALEMGRMAGVGGLLATDRVFGLLEREFDVHDVRQAVAESIRPPDDYGLDAHRILLDLATSRAGVTQIVTTNFDLLFEECLPDLPRWGPPRLPDPRNPREFHGIVHLHGRVDNDYVGPFDDEFVVSSADFGRAYLSDGWATRFIQSLLSRYQIVFVGYSADDPPIQYLLEALNLHSGTSARLFAFQEGDAGEAAALWEHRGVRAIAFDNSSGYAPLWDTLSAWAARARDVDGWHDKLIARAAAGPAATDTHFRGVIAKMLATPEGAHRIATATETLDSRWLLALDPVQRYATSGRVEPYDDTTEMFFPFDALGLDCDTPPEPLNPDDPFHHHPLPEGVFDPFARNFLDDEDGGQAGDGVLRGPNVSALAPMPPRLANLGVWIQRVAHEPVALWWAAHQQGLHPQIQQHIQSALRYSPDRFPDAIRKGWQWLFSAWSDRRDDPDMIRYDLEARGRRDGWSASLVRDVAAMYKPQLKVERAFGVRHPFHWQAPIPDDIIRVRVDYPRPHVAVAISDAYVLYAVSQFRGNLELAIALEHEISGHNDLYLQTTRANDDGPGLDESSYGLTGPMIFFQKLMTRFAELDRDGARAEVSRWPVADEHVFARLRIWAAGRRDLLDGPEAASVFLGLPEQVFWGSQHERDVLYALRDRWPDFSVTEHERLEARLREGSFPWSDDVRGGPTRAAAFERLNRLFWLSGQGVAFGFDLDAEMTALRKLAPEWTRAAGADAAASNAPEVSSIGTDDTPDSLMDLPISEILPRVREAGRMDIRDRVQRAPFSGLVKRSPVCALMALAHAARCGEAPRHPWADFLRLEARDANRPRMIRAIAARLCRLPIGQFREIAYPVADWMERNAAWLFGDAADALAPLWNRMIEALMIGSTNAPHRPDRSWADDALNAPVGRLVNLLMKDPAKNGLENGAGYPPVWRGRLDDLLGLPGDLRRQALVLIAFHVAWLYNIDPNWTETAVLPAVEDESDDGDAFWGGFLWAARIPSRELFVRLKPCLMARTLQPPVREAHDSTLAAMLLAGWGGDADADKPERLISDLELREVLIHSDNQLRRQVLRTLERWSSGSQGRWRERVIPFLSEVWPKQRALKIPEISVRLAEFAMASGDLMPEVVALVLPRLVPVRDGSFITMAINSEDPDFSARRHPRAMLDLLEAVLPEDSRGWPYNFEKVLDILVQAPETSVDPRLADLRRRRER
ncbi:SIR2 family protein [Methylosinus sp. Sm6]|uniref:SIR2 family protein n=1 Tax=Methylosinus sp. Sm6 TaxID=2866948 RepID=UPI001C9955C6|nr:SIR2 family protein [Methylosinus sp. Sm6]MBY6240028.1 SIR2 family protein [Methylosinus sp. Sm6]